MTLRTEPSANNRHKGLTKISQLGILFEMNIPTPTK